jgi:hypothetical protein
MILDVMRESHGKNFSSARFSKIHGMIFVVRSQKVRIPQLGFADIFGVKIWKIASEVL